MEVLESRHFLLQHWTHPGDFSSNWVCVVKFYKRVFNHDGINIFIITYLLANTFTSTTFPIINLLHASASYWKSSYGPRGSSKGVSGGHIHWEPPILWWPCLILLLGHVLLVLGAQLCHKSHYVLHCLLIHRFQLHLSSSVPTCTCFYLVC